MRGRDCGRSVRVRKGVSGLRRGVGGERGERMEVVECPDFMDETYS